MTIAHSQPNTNAEEVDTEEMCLAQKKKKSSRKQAEARKSSYLPAKPTTILASR